jgi:hypothetical protein
VLVKRGHDIEGFGRGTSISSEESTEGTTVEFDCSKIARPKYHH